MSDTMRLIKDFLLDSVDATPERVSVFYKTGVGSYAEHDQFIGVRVPTLRKIAKIFASTTLEDLGLLIQSSINEERLLALIILTQQYKKGLAENKEVIYQFYRKNLLYVNNWNLVDSSAHLIMGAHLFKQDCSVLEELAKSKNLWEKRIAIVATWYFIRNSELEWTFKIASILKNDQNDLIHKAVGWMLREAGKKDETSLIRFLSANQMPKTMIRYATEKLSQEQKKALDKAKVALTHP